MSSVRVELGGYVEIVERRPKGAGMRASRAFCGAVRVDVAVT
jgi:hypothetical protein